MTFIVKQTLEGCSDCSRALVCSSWWSWVSLKKFWRLAEQPPTWQHLWNGHHSSDPMWHRAHYRKILVKMKVSEVKSKFFKIEAYFASNAFVSFKNTPKSFQISFLGIRNAKFIIVKSKVKKSFLVKNRAEELDFCIILRQKFLRNFTKIVSEMQVQHFWRSSRSRIVFI